MSHASCCRPGSEGRARPASPCVAAGCAGADKPAERWRFADVAPPLVEPHVMVVSDNPASSEVGAEILRRGGNAIDAIVARRLRAGGRESRRRQHRRRWVPGVPPARRAGVRARLPRGRTAGAATRDMYVDSAGNGHRCIARGRPCRWRARLGGGALGHAPALRRTSLARGGPPGRGTREGARARQPARGMARRERRAASRAFPSSTAIFMRGDGRALARRRHAVPGRPRAHARPHRGQRR